MPSIVGFSGGKDSTVVGQLVLEHLLSQPRGERKLTVHIVANGTLVESPFVIRDIDKVLDQMRRAASALAGPLFTAGKQKRQSTSDNVSIDTALSLVHDRSAS